MYEFTDRIIKKLNRVYLREFTRLKLMRFDELNVVKAVKDVYRKCVNAAKKRYLEIARHYYWIAFNEAKSGREIGNDDWINNDWLLDYLEESDPVTLYSFMPEVERKRQRLVEALAVTTKPREEIDKSLRFWAQQSQQYADNITDTAVLRGYSDAGVKRVRWITERDDRVCPICRERDLRVYDIDKVPPKPHWRCRCVVVPVKSEK